MPQRGNETALPLRGFETTASLPHRGFETNLLPPRGFETTASLPPRGYETIMAAQLPHGPWTWQRTYWHRSWQHTLPLALGPGSLLPHTVLCVETRAGWNWSRFEPAEVYTGLRAAPRLVEGPPVM